MIGDHIRPLKPEETPSQIIAAGERAQDLMNHPGWADLLAQVREEDRTWDMTVLGGKHSEVEYARMTGVRVGLARVFEVADELVRDGKAQRAVEEGTYG